MALTLTLSPVESSLASNQVGTLMLGIANTGGSSVTVVTQATVTPTWRSALVDVRGTTTVGAGATVYVPVTCVGWAPQLGQAATSYTVNVYCTASDGSIASVSASMVALAPDATPAPPTNIGAFRFESNNHSNTIIAVCPQIP